MKNNPNFCFRDGKLYTRNLVRGFRVHGEDAFIEKGIEWRNWRPQHSKLASAIKKGLKTEIPVGASVLYLGAANGVTPSFVSDLVGHAGMVYCVEFAPRSASDLIRVCEQRKNMVPILADARTPEKYAEIGGVDFVFEDVADPEQARIMLTNSRFLNKGGIGMIAVKARCVDSTEDPKRIFARVEKELSSAFEIRECLDIEPFEADHEFLVLEKK